MKPVILSKHAQEHLADRGATFLEMEVTIREGEQVPAKKGRRAFRKNFSFGAHWKGKYYEGKQVMPIVVEEPDKYIVEISAKVCETLYFPPPLMGGGKGEGGCLICLSLSVVGVYEVRK